MSFGQSHGLTPLKMSFLWPFLKLQFFPLKIILFFPKHQKRCFLIEFLWKKQIRKNSIFGQNPWTNPFKKVHFLVLVKTSIFWSKNDCFLFKISKKIRFLDKIHELNPLENVYFLALLKTFIFSLKIILFFPQFRNTIFSDVISVKNADKKKFDFFTKSMDWPLY